MVLMPKASFIDCVGIDSKTGRYLAAVDPQTLQPVPACFSDSFRHKNRTNNYWLRFTIICAHVTVFSQ